MLRVVKTGFIRIFPEAEIPISIPSKDLQIQTVHFRVYAGAAHGQAMDGPAGPLFAFDSRRNLVTITSDSGSSP